MLGDGFLPLGRTPETNGGVAADRSMHEWMTQRSVSRDGAFEAKLNAVSLLPMCTCRALRTIPESELAARLASASQVAAVRLAEGSKHSYDRTKKKLKNSIIIKN